MTASQSCGELLNRALNQLQHGRLDQARALCKKCLHLEPDNFNALHLYGVLCLKQSEYERAVDYLKRACDRQQPLRPHAQAFNNLSVALLNLGRLDAALNAVQDAIKLAGKQLAFIVNRANVYELQGDWSAMEQDLQDALQLDPDDEHLLSGLALAMRQQQRPAEALALLQPALNHASPCHELCWEGLLLIGLQQGQQALLQQSVTMAYRLQRDPGHWLDQVADYLCEQQHSDLALPLYQQAAKLGLEGPELEHKMAALRGDMPDRAPDRYVEQLYQTHAAQFERRLLGKLGYRAPWQLTEQLQQLGYKRFDKVLDLGCGSGLGGQQLRQAFDVEHLTGVDLASKMLDLARTKACYDQLNCAELGHYLSQQQAQFDLICALDVLIYQGKLEALFSQLAARLAKGGLFAFSTELADGTGSNDYRLSPSGRYQHRRAYIERLCATPPWQPLRLVEIDLRQEAGRQTPGLLVVVEKAA
ncbi:tetratricopeptide repeat protein [Motiliproteus sp.]|uniref:tetratricopeptide repeat protein n=1 Tax=Motiliproteus sp. TaxID=1898955 RepID=UPI003BA8A594